MHIFETTGSFEFYLMVILLRHMRAYPWQEITLVPERICESFNFVCDRRTNLTCYKALKARNTQ